MRRHEARLKALKKRMLRKYPCVRGEALAGLLWQQRGLTAAVIRDRWRAGKLIGIRGPGGALFPRFQVDESRGRIHAVLPRTLEYFCEVERAYGWAVFLWFTTPRPGIGDRIPAECLSSDPEAVLEALEFEEHEV